MEFCIYFSLSIIHWTWHYDLMLSFVRHCHSPFLLRMLCPLSSNGGTACYSLVSGNAQRSLKKKVGVFTNNHCSSRVTSVHSHCPPAFPLCFWVFCVSGLCRLGEETEVVCSLICIKPMMTSQHEKATGLPRRHDFVILFWSLTPEMLDITSVNAQRQLLKSNSY